MCVTDRPEDASAAIKLQKILNEYSTAYGHTEETVRKMIRCKWERIAALAHSVHEEECRESKRIEARELAELARLKAKYEC